MQQIITLAGVPLVVLLSFLIALGIEIVLLTSAFQLIARGAANAAKRDLAGTPKSSAR